MISISTKLTGDMSAALDKLSAACGEQALRAAGYAGAKVVMDEAIHNASGVDPRVITGTLKRNIIVKRAEERSQDDKQQTYLVTVRKGELGGDDAYYWRFVENGHKFVKRKQKKSNWKAWRAAMDIEYGKSSVPAHPFLRPAYESKKEQAIEAMRTTLSKKISELLKGAV